MGEHAGSIKKVWTVFFILLIITAVEVGLGMYNTHNPGFVPFSWLKWTFILLTLAKAYYIVDEFMHLGHEVKGLRFSVILPIIVLVPYLIFIVLTEAGAAFESMQ